MLSCPYNDTRLIRMTLKTYNDIVDCCFDNFTSNGLNANIINTLINLYPDIEIKEQHKRTDYIINKIMVSIDKAQRLQDSITIIGPALTNIITFNKNEIEISYKSFDFFEIVNSNDPNKIEFYMSDLWSSRKLFQTNMNDLRYWAKDRTLFDVTTLRGI